MRSRLLRSCTRFHDDVGRQFNLLLEGIGFITFPESPALSRLEPCGRSFEVLYGLFRPRCQDGFLIFSTSLLRTFDSGLPGHRCCLAFDRPM